ncbi:hypothetical protein DFH07DRAFT_735770 [Mycena maculata]|uniref:SET domain-containing protein n=1 Tax=Mycena maculata TaxID=230809 RepID=A0AAD7NPR0_9AGAR|nr:hypothetical protein DFH07DRAFT_735770 [Mycena maculata]
MDSIPFRRQSTWYGGRGIFATEPIPKGALLHRCHSPYASVIYRRFRKEVCGQCFAYAFDARRSAWNVKLQAGSGIWFCRETCRDEWVRSENVDQLVGVMNAAVDKLAKSAEKCAAGQIVPPELLVSPMTQEVIDAAWATAENAPLPTDAQPGFGLALDEMELDTVRFILSALVRRYIQDSAQTGPLLNSWTDLLELQNNELPFISGRPEALASHLRMYTFVRRIVHGIPALTPYLRTSETVRAVFARDQGNVFGMYEMSQEGDEMFGWSMYVSASYFNHDCAPNVRKERAGRALLFYATRDVAVGEELCINYIDVTDSVAVRREQLSLNWYFDCVCQRCKEEMQTRLIELET